MDEWDLQQMKEEMASNDACLLYLYTPLCGTCQVASKMLTIVAELLPDLKWGKSDLNYMPELAKNWAIESVPCLVIVKNNKVIEKHYAFHSVPFLYETLKNLQKVE